MFHLVCENPHLGSLDKICKRRIKHMDSKAKHGQRPRWISETLWITLSAYWVTDVAKKKNKTYSHCHLSPRGGLGPHVHLSGSKSYDQVQQELEVKLGRPVSIGEIFIETHTKPDGSYVDRKAEKIVQIFEMNVQKKLAELETEASTDLDGSSLPRELTADEHTAIFLQANPLRRIHEELIMELAASRRLLSMASPSNLGTVHRLWHYKSN